MKGPLKVDNPITSKIDGFKMWAIHFCKNNMKTKKRTLGCMFSRINFACMPHEGWMKKVLIICPKMDENEQFPITSRLLALLFVNT